jgi:isopentenyldiphosphate isomerase
VKWISFEELKKDIVCNPTKYTPWFVVALKRVLKEIAHA